MPEKRKNCIIFAFSLELLATMSFSLFAFLEPEQYTLFFVASIFLRGVQGVGAAIIMTCSYSFVINEMAREKDKYIGYIETTMGVGDTVGPAVGGLVYAYFGYVGTFMAFSGFIYIGIACSLIMIPSSLNQRVYS